MRTGGQADYRWRLIPCCLEVDSTSVCSASAPGEFLWPEATSLGENLRDINLLYSMYIKPSNIFELIKTN